VRPLPRPRRAGPPDYAEQLAVGFEQLGRAADAAALPGRRPRSRAPARPRNRVNVVLDDGRQLELDQVSGIAGRLRFVFERDRGIAADRDPSSAGAAAEAGTAGRLEEALALVPRRRGGRSARSAPAVRGWA
jgi:hypothetical protein